MEFVASAFRATATDPQNPGALVDMLANQLGMPLYQRAAADGVLHHGGPVDELRRRWWTG